MHLTPAERRILINQHRILEQLEEDSTKQADHREKRKILERGLETFYGDRPSGTDAPEVSQEDTVFVTDVLTMYSNLQASFDELEDPEAVDPDQVLFPGFNDGRDEIDLLRVSRFLIDDQGRYDWLRLEGDDLSALMPMRDTYERMLEELRDRAGIRWDALSEDTIRAVLDAGNRF